MALSPPHALITALISSLGTADTAGDPSDSLRSAHAKNVLLALHVLFPNELLPALDLLDRNLVTRLRLTDGAGEQQPPPQTEAQPQAPSPRTSPSPPMSQYSTVQALLQPQPQSQLQTNTPASASLHGQAPQAPPPEPDANGSETRDNGQTQEFFPTVYIVRSAQLPSRPNYHHHHQQRHPYDRPYQTPFSHSDATPLGASYEVRPLAWSCSCPAFAFAAFPAPSVLSTPGADGTPKVATAAAAAPFSQIPAHKARDPATTLQPWVFGGLSSVFSADGSGSGSVPVCKHLLACVLADRGGAAFGAGVVEREVASEELAGWAAGWGD